MSAQILVTGSRNRTNLIGQFFFWLVNFFFKKIATENLFLLLDSRSRWPGLLRCSMNGLRVCLHIFCVSVCTHFFQSFFLWIVLLRSVNTSCFGVVINRLVSYFFCALYFCIFRCVVISVLRIVLFPWLLGFLLFTIEYAFACLPYFLQWFCAFLQSFLLPKCSLLSLLVFCRFLPVLLPRFWCFFWRCACVFVAAEAFACLSFVFRSPFAFCFQWSFFSVPLSCHYFTPTIDLRLSCLFVLVLLFRLPPRLISCFFAF